MNFDSFAHLNFDAPNLLFFDVGGVFRDVTFTNTHNLALVWIGLYVSDKIDKEPPLFLSNLLKFFIHLPHIRRLEIQSYFLKSFIYMSLLPTVMHCLSPTTTITMPLQYLAHGEVPGSSPNFQELEMLARTEVGSPRETFTSFWEDERQQCVLKLLQLVKVSIASGTKTELNFSRFILLASSQLERMTVTTANRPGLSDIMKELLRFRRTSPYVEIIYIDSRQVFRRWSYVTRTKLLMVSY
ncbi:hypothetical protein MLD38_022280 [Melastoma candidum]|uniref:Uncharacterized protein n=1 Tax=Melastoma candidum TaxID=119954 RepID=A0ACB9QJZ0_9MYRT|nr:hypothetical protein MLD38_022280 [Melastoma candidum]